jgi:ABC-type transporter Mla maintaining outer membrane lipid asymmetry ATPase subunit MlaF
MDDAELNEIRSSIGMLFQHSALFDSMTVLENVVFPLVERRVSGLSEAEKKARNVLQQLGLEETADTLPSELSSGQQKRVALARAVVTGPKLIVYDEPTTGQDPIMAAYVEEMIVEAQKSFGLTSIVISHDMASTFRIADHVAMLHEGEIIMQGPPASFLQSVDPRVRTFVFAADPERASQGGTPSSLDNSEEKGVIGGSDSGSDTSV